jgi:hypothetical protein
MSVYKGNQQGEEFVGNVPAKGGVPAHYRDIKSARLGKQAFDINGKVIPQHQMLPLFIHKSEMHIYNAIYLERMKRVGRKVIN